MIADKISKTLNLPVSKVQVVLDLLQEGATIPFLARYRKERTGNMDEEQLREVESLKETYTKLEARRETIVKSLT